MSCEEKCDMLNRLIRPFGYCYVPDRDIFSTNIDAPQRLFGYTSLYDYYAPYFGMVFDCMPVYFDYDGRTWLVEIWKGQYGINTGCEVGIYKADSPVAPVNRKNAVFRAIDNGEMMPVSVRLYKGDDKLSGICRRHWWITAFNMGCYSEPKDLSVKVSIIFNDMDMLEAFTDALAEQEKVCYCSYGMNVRLVFGGCHSCRKGIIRKCICRYSQWKNRVLTRVFLKITEPFEKSIDRALFLYYCLPPFFVRVFSLKRRKRYSRNVSSFLNN